MLFRPIIGDVPVEHVIATIWSRQSHIYCCYVFEMCVQILRFWTLSIVLSFSKNTVLFIFQNTTFRKLDSVSVFRLNLFSWAQSIELVPGPEIGTSSIDWAQLCRFYLKTETEFSLRNVMFWKINRTVFT
jgi:predicted membrane protein